MSARILLVALAVSVVLAAPAQADDAAVQRGLDRLVASEGGPVGAIATLNRGGRTVVLASGRADVTHPGVPRSFDHMRIASVAKAFNGAIALHLVQRGKLDLDDTIGSRLPTMPRAWARVTVRQMLNHTSGLPDYTKSDGFAAQARDDPRGFVSPAKIISWVRADPLVFAPDSRYEYSNTDNIVVGLIAEAVTGRSYERLLSDMVFRPAGLTATSFDMRRVSLPSPFIHGYVVEPGGRPQDVTTFLSPSGAWASGGVVSTPANLNRFIRAYLAQWFFGGAQAREQLRFVPGSSSPPGPGENSAGLAVFRYRTRCGTVYGHTGNFPGYVQFAAATRDGRRGVTTSLNIPAPTGTLLARLRNVQTAAVCALLGR